MHRQFYHLLHHSHHPSSSLNSYRKSGSVRYHPDRVASRDTILNEKGASLTPGAYVGVAPVEDDGVDFAQRMKEIHKELLELQAESNRLMETISKNLEEMGV